MIESCEVLSFFCLEKMVFSDYNKQRIIYLKNKGFNAPNIAKLLKDEGIRVSRVGVYKFLKHFEENGTLLSKPGSERPSKITQEIKEMVEEQMRRDDETTAFQLQALLTTKGYELSLKIILRSRSSLGWTFRGSAYCQLIREENKTKRLTWAQKYQCDDFENVTCNFVAENKVKHHGPSQGKHAYCIGFHISFICDFNLSLDPSIH